MSVTTTSRVDATTPVLAQIVDAATKAFTGSLQVSTTDSLGRDLQVEVWFRDGDIYAVHAAGWTPPAAEYVHYRTGEDFSGREESPFRLAFETRRDGQPLLTAAELDAPRRDWAYGLLAASLTWAKPKFHRNRKATTTTNQINASAWQKITADVAARVDGLESAWRVIGESLTAAGIRPVSAGRACAVMGVAIEGSDLFTGAESLDQVAGRTGQSRYVLLEELSRAILSGYSPQFVQCAPPETQLLVPEHWEDPARAWGLVAEGPPEPEVEPEADPEPVDLLPQPWPEPESLVEVQSPEVDADPARDEEDEPELEQPEVEAEPEMEAEPEPELEVAVEVPEPEVIEEAEAAPAPFGPGSSRALITGWLQASTGPADADVRASIVHRLVDSAQAEAVARRAEVALAEDDLDRAELDGQARTQDTAHAGEVLGAAREQLAHADADVARVQAEFAGVVQAAQHAAARAHTAAELLAAQEATLEQLIAQLAAQEAAVEVDQRASVELAEAARVAQLEVDETAAPALAQVTAVAAEVLADAVVPAEEGLLLAEEHAQAAAAAVAQAQRTLAGSTVAATQAQAIVDSLDFGAQAYPGT